MSEGLAWEHGVERSGAGVGSWAIDLREARSRDCARGRDPQNLRERSRSPQGSRRRGKPGGCGVPWFRCFLSGWGQEDRGLDDDVEFKNVVSRAAS